MSKLCNIASSVQTNDYFENLAPMKTFSPLKVPSPMSQNGDIDFNK